MHQRTDRSAFTLIEIILYLAIFAIVGGALFVILTRSVSIGTKEVASDEVGSQLNFAMQQINALVKSSSAIEIATSTATTTLKLRMQNTALDPTCIYVSNGRLKLAQGPDPYDATKCTATTTDLTTDKVTVDILNFKRNEFPGGHDQVAVDIQMSNIASGASKVSRALRLGVSRVSAATFDSSLLPGADAQYEVGYGPNKRWKNISISNLLYLGQSASDPAGSDGAVYYNTTSKTFRGYGNGAWNDIGSALWTATSTNIFETNLSGNVGIGTNNPVNGRLELASTANVPAIYMSGAQAGWGTGMQFNNTTSTSTRNYGLYSGSDGAFHIADVTSSADRIFIKNDGSVGIGTTAPEAGNSLNTAGNIKIGQANAMYLQLNATSDARIWTSGMSNGLLLQPSGGNVGIGTTNPVYPLDVNGVIRGNRHIFLTAYPGYGTGDGSFYYDNTGNIDTMRFNTGIRVNKYAYIDGAVGIGTTAPVPKFQVAATANGNSAAFDGTVAIGAGMASDSTNVNMLNIRSTTSGSTHSAVSVTNSLNQTMFQIRDDIKVGIGSLSGSYTLEVNGNAGNTTGVWANISDARLKKDIVPLKGSLDIIKGLQGVAFHWKDPKEDEKYGLMRGFIAQDVEKVMPDWVKTGPDGYKRIEPTGINAVLVEAIKEQQKQIESQKKDIDTLKNEVKTLKK